MRVQSLLLAGLLGLGACCDVTKSTNIQSSTGGTGGTSGATHGSSGGTTGAGVTNVVPYAPGWPKWHNDNADDGLSQADTSQNAGAVVWKFSVGVPQAGSGMIGQADPNPTYMNSPVVDGAGNVYQLGMDGTFYALGDGGTELWSTTLLPPNPDSHPSTPILAADGTIYLNVGSDNPTSTPTAQLYHLAAASGSILFQAGPPTGQGPCSDCGPSDGFDVSPSIGTDGLLFDADDFGQLVDYTLTSGGGFTQGNEVFLNPGAERVAVALDGLNDSYWCNSNVCVAVSSPAAGFQVMSGWPSGGARIGTVAVPYAAILSSYYSSPDLALDAKHTGWLMVEAGTQHQNTGSTEVVAMDPADGSLHWDTKLPSGPTPGTFSYSSAGILGQFSSDVGNSAPAIGSDGTVYVGNVDGLYALDGTTGAIKWTYVPSQDSGANADVDSAAAIGGDGTLFFGTAGGTFYAVKPDGTERFHYTTGGRISSSPAIGPDGTVFVVSDDGFLYAIR